MIRSIYGLKVRQHKPLRLQGKHVKNLDHNRKEKIANIFRTPLQKVIDEIGRFSENETRDLNASEFINFMLL